MERTVRICTMEEPFPIEGEYSPPPRVASIYCLVEWRDVNPSRGKSRDRRGNYLTQNPRTNLSHEQRWDGWLGTTNNISERAQGAWRVVSYVGWDNGKYRVSLARVEI